MGAFICRVVARLLGDGKPPEGEIDHNIFVCCSTLNVAEHEKDIELQKTEEDDD